MSQETVKRTCELADAEAKRAHDRLVKAIEVLAITARYCCEKLGKNDYSDMRLLFAIAGDVEKSYHEAMKSHAVASHLQSLALTLSTAPF